MKVEKTDNANEVKLELTIEAQKFVEAIKSVYNKNAKYFNIPGFRKGKAPYHIVEKTYGAQAFYEDAFNEIVPEILEKELVDNKIDAVSRPEIDIIQIEKGKDLIFTAIVQTKPEVKLGKYKGIEIKKIEYNVTDKDIEAELEAMQEKNSRLVSVEDRSVKDGDIATIDFEGSVDGVLFDGGKSDNYDLTIGSNQFIPGFEEQVVGMKIDEVKDLKVKFPEEYFSKELAGKDAIFKVTLHGIKEKQLAKLDDEFAKDTSEFDTLAELKASIKEKLEHENEHKVEHETEDAVIAAVCEKVEIDIPSGMLELEVDNMVKDIETRLSYQGMKLEQYLQFMNKTLEDFRKESEEQAKKQIKIRLVLEAIQKELEAELKIEQAEIDEKLEEMAKQYGKKAEEIKDNEQLIAYINDNLKVEKTLEYLIKNAKIK